MVQLIASDVTANNKRKTLIGQMIDPIVVQFSLRKLKRELELLVLVFRKLELEL